jgi:hypothetical protein
MARPGLRSREGRHGYHGKPAGGYERLRLEIETLVGIETLHKMAEDEAGRCG